MSSNRTCPCKNLTWSLSSFTAAEFGDTHALNRALAKGTNSSSASRRQNQDGSSIQQSTAESSSLRTGGITPLHLAAQHGHVSATWLLLEQGYPVDGVIENHETSCTPLHRASFSGAVATMRLLMETKKANLLARDTSFGDQRTPLHKAAAGGRYLAVSLLVDALREQAVLKEALTMVDRVQRTPLQEVAQHFQKIQEEERQSVARWDAVAGGSADWDKCVSLLESEMGRLVGQGENLERMASSSRDPAQHLPSHSFSKVDCLNCTEGGECVTASWSNAFTKALQQNFNMQQQKIWQQQHSEPSKEEDLTQHNNMTSKAIEEAKAENTHKVLTTTSLPSQGSGVGRSCKACGRKMIVLFPVEDDAKLVCKKCQPKRVRKPIMAT